MRKILSLLFILCFISVQSQVNTNKNITEPGVYKSVSQGQNILLKMNEDKTYEMVFLYGNYETKNDTINFKSGKKNDDTFVLKNDKIADFSSTLKLNFVYDQVYLSSYYLYIGTQEGDGQEIKYKKLVDFFPNGFPEYGNKDLIIDLEKTKYLYLVDTQGDKIKVAKFQIADSYNKVNIEYQPFSFSSLELKGYIDGKTNQLAVSNGKTPLLFLLEKQTNEKPKVDPDTIPLVNFELDSNWYKKNGFKKELGEEYAVDSTATAIVSEYNFVHLRSKSLEEAKIATQKSKKKYLIVSFNNDKNAKTDFENFLKTSEKAISSNMYDSYKEEYDNFNFYLATLKDKSLLSKYKIKSAKELLFLNTEGDLVYHTQGDVTDKVDLFLPYSTMAEELKKANEQLFFDKVIKSKTATIDQTKAALKKVIKSEIMSSQVGVQAVDAVKFLPPTVVKEVEMKEEKLEETKTVVDTTVVEAPPAVYEDYSLIKDKENLYKMQSTRQDVQSKWAATIQYYKKNKTYDKDFLYLIKAELNNEGFSTRLTNNYNLIVNQQHFDMLDYVFTHYKTILESESVVKSEEEYDYTEKNIQASVVAFFYNACNEYTNPSKSELARVLEYNKKYVAVSEKNSTVLESYLTNLKNNIDSIKNKEEYLLTYEDYYNSVIKDGTNVVESLDKVYTAKSESDYDTNWLAYKNSFALLANEVCWYIVEKTQDKTAIQKAIKWSETSLILSKENHYFVDTLAQLYYKNGQKEKAIALEEIAIEIAKKENLEAEYVKVIEKMKNGSY